MRGRALAHQGGFDNDAQRINFMPRHISVSELASFAAPEVLSDERSDAENKVYSVEAVLLGWKQETAEQGDRDFHLVLVVGDHADDFDGISSADE